MKPSINRRNGTGRGVIPWMILAAFVIGANAFAADTTYTTTGIGAYGANDTTGTASLDAAVAAVNTGVDNARTGSGATYAADVNIQIGKSQTGATQTAGTYWLLDGASNHSNYGSGIGGFNSVTINGSGATGGRATLTGSTGGMILKVLHADDRISVSNLNVTGGNYTGNLSEANFGGEVGGAGMTLGGNGAVGDHLGPNTVSVQNVTASNNTINVNTSTGSNAYGAGILVNGHGLNAGAVGPNRSDVVFSNVDLTGNTITFTRTGGGGSIRGGGARIGYAQSFAYTGGTVKNNSVTLNNGDHAAGGGLSVDGDSADSYTNVTITGVEFNNNYATVNGVSGAGVAVARGGGFYYLGSKPGGVVSFGTGTSFLNNSANANAVLMGDTMIAHGGAAFVMIANADAKFTGVTFSANSAQSDGEAAGGAIAVDTHVAGVANGNLLVSGSNLTGNRATAGNGDAMGGAVYTKVGTAHQSLNSNYTNNGAATSGTGTMAAGGAIYFTQGTQTVTGGTFDSNVASASGSGSNARGGAVYFDTGNHTVDGATFKNNSAEATNAASGTAQGGALYFAGQGTTNTVKNSTFDGNRVRSSSYASGGAIYLEDGILNVQDSTFTNNAASASTQTNAHGGAIFVNTESTTASILNLSGDVTIEGNRAGGSSEGIYFGRANAASSMENAQLNLTGTGKISILDPIVVNMDNGHDFIMTKSGTGELFWDGKNIFTNAAGTSRINLNSGTIVTGDKFTAIGQDGASGVSGMNVNIASSATLVFSASRDKDTALFDFTSSTGANAFTVANGATIAADFGRELTSQTGKFAIATGIDDTLTNELTNAKNNFNLGQYNGMASVLGLSVENDTLYAMVQLTSPFDTSGRNPQAALPGLQSLVKANDGKLVSDAEFSAILSSPYATTPEIYMDQGRVMMNLVDTVARQAVEYGARTPYHQRMRMEGAVPMRSGAYYAEEEYYAEDEYYESYDAYPSLAVCNTESGPRIWGGYVGNLNRRDTDGGYQGYKVESHGFILGMNYDFSANGTLGFYGGYTNSETKGRMSASKVEADTGHFGIIGRMSPLDAAPEFSVYADAGYHFAYNDYHREMGGYRADGSFDQETYTGAIGLEYMMQWRCMNLVPHFEARYLNLDQQALVDGGNSSTITRTDGITKGSFNTRLGVELSRDFQLASGVFTPALNVSWKHEYGDRQFLSSSYYVKDPMANSFVLSSAPIDRDSADIGVALRTLYQYGPMTKLGVNVAYNLNISRNSNVHSIYAGFDLGF